MEFASRYKKLNTAQKQAVDTIDGPVMVIAGPGTGKTELLGMRVANILQKTDTLPGSILCLTFTESGAAAMRQRLAAIIGADAYKVAIHTFHSFGTEVINQYGEFFYHGAHFRAADELSCHEILRGIFDELPYDNPLASTMNGDYTHLADTLTSISELKKSSLTSDELLAVMDANDKVADAIEPLLAEVFAARISKQTITQLASLLDTVRATIVPLAVPTVTPLARILGESLEVAIDDATTSGSTKPLTAWRTMWMKKNDTGAFVLKSRERATKLRAVSDIYLQYLTRMQEAALYDFDDMIMRVVHAMEVFPELLFNLQETYQYILVDEFQDTNMAQMRILSNLTNNEIHNDRPNILVVGDDDQAIYSFQGANVGNISGFLERFAQTKQITLVDNYRSSETILTHARQVITQGSDRLEARMPQLNKTLTAHRSEEGSVALVELPTIHDEHTWLVKQIEALQKRGVTGSSVAVLARRHHELVALLPYFAEKGIRVNYERRDNVLDQELIVAIEHIAQLLIALYEQRYSDANSLLPRLLAHPAFAVSPLTIWQLSLKAQHNHQTWMELLALTPELQPLHDWLISTAQQLADTPLEHVMDRIVGSRPQASGFVSPLFAYFFSPQRLEETPDAYLTHLDALRTIRTKLRDYRPDETPTLQSFVEFIRHHRQLGSTITSVRPATHTSDDAVNVMTAHKSKGLEFDHVFVIGAIDTTWGERVRTRSRLIGYPQNLPLAPAGDTFNDRLRLFFVAMTRARTHLTLSYSAADARQKTTLPASFLVGENWQTQHHERPATIQQLVQSAEIAWYQPIIDPIQPTMHQLLQPMLDSYKLSSTHLTNFLDVTRGGPQAFLLTNLLRFPQAISPSAAYGSAVHATLQRAHAHLSATGHQRPIEDILHDFEEQLRAQRLTENDFASYLQKGSDVLLAFLEAMYHHFSRTQKTELSFANQSVFLGKAHLTGSLDLVDITGTSITVTDYKTGKALRSWTGKTDYEKIKLHKYKQQLMFYNLLTLHSRDYHTYSFEKGVLQFVEPTHAGEIVALEAHFSRDDLEDFSQLIQKVWQHITTLNLPSTGSYPPTYAGIVQFEHDLLANTLVE